MNAAMLPDQKTLKQEYEKYAEVRALTTRDMEALVEESVAVLASRPTVKGRPKSFASFFKKYLRVLKSKDGPMGESGAGEPVMITDLIGIRVICPFIEDLEAVEKLLKGKFEVIEVEKKGADYSFKEFGYESTHLLVKIPADIVRSRGYSGSDAAEIQIRTILQDAWAEVEHELVYKAEFTPFDEPMKRKLAAVNASLSLADTIFQEVRAYQRQLNEEMGKRRESFFQKIEESTDALIFDTAETKQRSAVGKEADKPPPLSGSSVDDLLLNALYAHNRNQFNDAIGFYSRILEMRIDDAIRSLIYKHRGMAYFAQSKYQEAVEDFSNSLKWDKKAYKAAYYRGVVWAVLQRYNEATTDFSLSLELNPYQSFCLFRRAQAWYHIGDYPQALGDCEASLALQPDNEMARKLRDLLQDKLRM